MRQRLSFVTAAVASLIVLSLVIPLGILARRQAEDRALSVAERDAQSIATALAITTSYVGPGITAATALAVLQSLNAPAGAGVFLPDGTVVGDPGDNDGDEVDLARAGSSFTVRNEEGAAVLVPVLSGGETTVVRVSVSNEELREGVSTAWAVLAGLAVVLIGVALVAADRLGRSIVEPVVRLEEAAGMLAGGNLGIRVEPAGPPEVASVATTFNTLADRLGDLLQMEREAAADLSHGLRTPLTALRLQVEGLPHGADRDSLIEDVDSLQAAVDQVITAARSRGSDPARSDLAAATLRRASFWEPLAADQGREFDVVAPSGPVMVGASAEELDSILDTLIENVFSHTEAAAPIRITASEDFRLTIEDGGGGFAAESAERGVSSGGSTGLGLDIVRRIVARAGGSVSIGVSDLGGAAVRIDLSPHPGQ